MRLGREQDDARSAVVERHQGGGLDLDRPRVVAPRLTEEETGPYTIEEVRRLLAVAVGRTIGLSGPLIELLRTHRRQQESERAAARQLWHDEGWVSTKPDGQPLNPNTDYHE